jgi:2-aminoethylphosphonate transport system ATP-binding protein
VTVSAAFTGAEVSAAAKAAAGSDVAFDKVSVAYRGAVVLKPLTMAVAAGEILAMIGPSGSGKTTALRAVAGFVRPADGRILIGGTDVTNLPPYERGLAMVVQNYALFPHMRVSENVAFGLNARGAARDLIAQRVEDSLRIVGMSKYASRFPRELSGGQQQRVAIARALAVRPRVLLLDEPLSALDAQIRRSMVEEIARLHADLPDLTILYVTHDQSEALTLADRIAILKDGELSAIGRTGELYRRPPNRFAAEFLGRANLLPVVVEGAAQQSGFVEARLGETKVVAAGADPLRAAAKSHSHRRRRTLEPHRGGAARDPLARRTDTPRRRDRRIDPAGRCDAAAQPARARRQARGLLLALGREPDRGRRRCLTPSRSRRARPESISAAGGSRHRWSCSRCSSSTR